MHARAPKKAMKNRRKPTKSRSSLHSRAMLSSHPGTRGGLKARRSNAHPLEYWHADELHRMTGFHDKLRQVLLSTAVRSAAQRATTSQPDLSGKRMQ